MEAIFTSTESAIDNVERRLLDQIQSASSADDIRSFDLELDEIADSLAVAIFNLHLLGRAQIAVDVQQEQPTSAAYAALVLEGAFEPLPFAEAITFFGQKVTLPPFVFGALSDAAKAKAFSIAAGATDQILSNIREILDRALVDGVTLSEFQEQAADVLSRAGVGARQPWYWETVYRTNLQQSYQVGRWKQVTDPAVRAARPYLRYVSALLRTSRQSHVEKHGLIYPVDHPFWTEWMPPNGFNCFCSVQSVSESLLEREGWEVATDEAFEFPAADTGFQINAGQTEEI